MSETNHYLDIINPNSNVPLYKQVLNILKEQIGNGKFKEGDKLPPELTLMHEFGVSRITIRSAISELVEDGVLVRSQGKGTFVAQPSISQPANDAIGFNRSCILAGKRPSTQLLSMDWVFPTENQTRYFGIDPHTKIIRSQRLRSVDGNPTMIEINHYPPSFSYLFEEDLNGSLFAILTRHKVQFKVTERTLETCFPTNHECQLLNIKSGTPLLLFRDVHTDLEGNPSFLSKQLYNTENMKFYF